MSRPQDEILDRLLAILEIKIGELMESIQGSRARSKYLVPDLAVIGLCREVLQLSKATLELTRSEVPYSAYTNARGALEAAQDLLLIVAKLPEGYALTGARILAADLLSREKLEAEHGELMSRTSRPEAETASRQEAETVEEESPEPGSERTWEEEPPSEVEGAQETTTSAEDSLRSWGQAWEKHLTGAAALVEQALGETRIRLEKRHSIHWAGMGRKRIAKFLQGHVDSLTEREEFSEFGAMQYAYYSILSIMTHPWPRFDTPFLCLKEGKIRIDVTPRDTHPWPRTPAIAATFAAHTATRVLRLLQENDPDDLLNAFGD